MSALMLRVIACVAMLLDHIGYQYGILSLRIIGRIAFPIFAYLIGNGYRHTSNRLRYVLRLGVFALLSQIPFSLFSNGEIHFLKWNVMFTLLLALLCIWATDELLKRRKLHWICFLPTVFICGLYASGLVQSDYGARGVLIALALYFLDGKTLTRRIATVVAVGTLVFYGHFVSAGVQLLKIFLGHDAVWPSVTRWNLIQFFSLGALPFIFSYNGKKGNGPKKPILAKLLQYGFYAFYPIHQLLLWLIR